MHNGTGAGIAGVDAAELVDAAFRRARTAMTIGDASGNFLEGNEALSLFLGYPVEELATMSYRDVTFAEDLSQSDMEMKRLAEGSSSEFTLDKRYVTASGDVVWGRLTAIAVRDDTGTLARVIAQIEDLHERKTVSAALSRRESHDELTGLVNRQVLHERLGAALEDPRRSARRLALLVVNLDRFDQVNAGLGQAAADLVLAEVARRLVAATRGKDSVARLAGDEFAVLVPGIRAADDAIALALDIRRSLGEPYWAAGNPVVVTARVGVVSAPADGGDAETLTRRARGAAKRAKDLSSGWAIHTAGADTASHEELGLVADLRAAIDQGDITVAYQPIVDSHGQTHSVEALARWYHRERGAVPPDQFIVLAEQNNLIAPLTKHVLTLAVQQGARWTSTLGSIPIAVNLSGTLLDDPDLVDDVTHIIASADLPPELITLEITETALADSSNPTIISALQALRDTGVRVSIDDFGTGYSSLAYLRQLPVDELKIDRSFIIDLDSDHRTSRIIRSIVGLAHSVDLAVVAEGVEDEGLASHLIRLGVDYLQGYFISKPAQDQRVAAWLDTHAPAAPAVRAKLEGSRVMNVLVVDDHPGVQTALHERLTQRNHTVDQARDSRAALDKLDRRMPDLVILNHPGAGWVDVETAPKLRDAGYTGPILLFSGSSPEDMATIRFPMDVWPVSQADDETLMRLIDGYAQNPPQDQYREEIGLPEALPGGTLVARTRRQVRPSRR